MTALWGIVLRRPWLLLACLMLALASVQGSSTLAGDSVGRDTVGRDTVGRGAVAVWAVATARGASSASNSTISRTNRVFQSGAVPQPAPARLLPRLERSASALASLDRRYLYLELVTWLC